MVAFRDASTNNPAARVLLDQYFATRSAGFPAEQGAYRRPSVDAAQFVPPHGAFLIIEGENLAGEPADVGCGGVRRIADGPLGARFEVKHVWVQPQARRLGAGRALMLELERRARDMGAAELVLDTHGTQTAAAALYAQLGFGPVERFNENPNATVWLGRALD